MSVSNEIYQEVTDQMVAALQEGTVPWHKPWRETGGLPLSMSTGRPYRGSNVWILWLTAARKGYKSPYWGTFDHIAALSGQVKVPAPKTRKGYRWAKPRLEDGSEDPTPRGVRAGEKHTTVIWWKRRRYTDPDDLDDNGKPKTKTSVSLWTFRVFNADQADSMPAKFWPAQSDGVAPEVLEAPETLWKAYLDGGPSLSHADRDRAFYVAGPDMINLPPSEAFEGAGEMYSTAFHEAGHSTGHSSRLNRASLTEYAHFGSQRYAREELVAEMTSAMLCALTGVDGVFDNSAAYIKGWLHKLADDPKMIIQASAQAQKAADFIQGITYADDPE